MFRRHECRGYLQSSGIQAIMGSFSAVWADIKLAGSFLANGGVLGLAFESSRKAMGEALDARNKTVQDANNRYVDIWNTDSQRFVKAVERAQSAASIAGIGDLDPMPYKPGLTPNPENS